MDNIITLSSTKTYTEDTTIEQAKFKLPNKATITLNNYPLIFDFNSLQQNS